MTHCNVARDQRAMWHPSTSLVEDLGKQDLKPQDYGDAAQNGGQDESQKEAEEQLWKVWTDLRPGTDPKTSHDLITLRSLIQEHGLDQARKLIGLLVTVINQPKKWPDCRRLSAAWHSYGHDALKAFQAADFNRRSKKESEKQRAEYKRYESEAATPAQLRAMLRKRLTRSAR